MLWGLAALGSYFFLFGFAYPAMARHAPGSVAGWIFGAFLLAALLSWASLALSSNPRSWLPHLIGGMSTVSVVFNGIGEAATRSAAQAQMSTGDYIGGVIGLALIIGVVLFARWRE